MNAHLDDDLDQDFDNENEVSDVAPVAKKATAQKYDDMFAGQLDSRLLAALKKSGIETPTPIQQKTIPLTLEGRDVLGVAQTGTGKTLAYALPIIERIMATGGKALVVVPTRELALQVEQSLRPLLYAIKPTLKVVCVIGGAPMYPQTDALRKDPSIILATPGRLQDHLERGNFKLSAITMVVLDEADRMFDMGFAPQITRFLEMMPKERQVLLFSATMPKAISELAMRHMSNPARVEITPPGTSVKEIAQELCFVSQSAKSDMLAKVLGSTDGKVIVFARTKRNAKTLARTVSSMGHSAAEIHSDRSLGQRKQALNGFRGDRYRVLVATDVAARGIDVDDVQLVVNYDLPDAAEDYVHRIGRTGRAGKSGKALSFATFDQNSQVVEIERLLKMTLSLSDDSGERPARRGGDFGASNGRSGGGRSRGGQQGGGARRGGSSFGGGRSRSFGGGRSFNRDDSRPARDPFQGSPRNDGQDRGSFSRNSDSPRSDRPQSDRAPQVRSERSHMVGRDSADSFSRGNTQGASERSSSEFAPRGRSNDRRGGDRQGGGFSRGPRPEGNGNSSFQRSGPRNDSGFAPRADRSARPERNAERNDRPVRDFQTGNREDSRGNGPARSSTGRSGPARGGFAGGGQRREGGQGGFSRGGNSSRPPMGGGRGKRPSNSERRY